METATVIAIISVSIAGLATLLTTFFKSMSLDQKILFRKKKNKIFF